MLGIQIRLGVMLQLRVLQALEIIEHNLVEEERGSQHTREKMKEARKTARDGKGVERQWISDP